MSARWDIEHVGRRQWTLCATDARTFRAAVAAAGSTRAVVAQFDHRAYPAIQSRAEYRRTKAGWRRWNGARLCGLRFRRVGRHAAH